MRNFFKNKLNLILLILLGISLLGVLIAYIWEGFVPISCILFGILCLFVGYLFLRKYIDIRNKKIDEFISDESKLKRKTSKFLEGESKMNVILLSVLFFIMGGILIYYALKIVGL